MTKIDSIIKEQTAFVKSTELTLLFLKLYKANPEQFDLLFSNKIQEEYDWNEVKDNPEYIWEFLNELFADWAYGYKNFIIKNTGVIVYIDFVQPKKKKDSIDICYDTFESFQWGWSF